MDFETPQESAFFERLSLALKERQEDIDWGIRTEDYPGIEFLYAVTEHLQIYEACEIDWSLIPDDGVCMKVEFFAHITYFGPA